MHNPFAHHYSPANPLPNSIGAPVRELHAGYRDKILSHLLQLNEDDRRMRFGTQTPDPVIASYVERLDFVRDTVFAIFDDNLNIVGLAHLAYLPIVKGRTREAEFGVSVLPEGRHKGFGMALLERAAIHSRNTRVESLFVHCLAHNKAMMHLAHKAGMTVEYAYGDADAYLKLPPSNPSTIISEAANGQWSDFDFALKSSLKQTSDMWNLFIRAG